MTRLGLGLYRVQLQDNYQALIQVDGSMVSPIAGTVSSAGAYVSGTAYRIITVGTTNYNLIGLPSGLTAAPGMTFVATGAGSGTGTAGAVISSGVSSIECMNANTANVSSGMLSNQPAVNSQGGYVYLQTLGNTGALVNPASSSSMNLVIILSNSSVQ